MNTCAKCTTSIVLLAVLAMAGCTPDKPTETRDTGVFVLYRLDGDRYPGDPVPEGAVLMHGWPILQECPIDSAATRHELFAALDAGIEGSGEVVPDCFNPRHAIRVESGSIMVDYVICFQCLQYEIWEGDKRVTGGMTTTSPKPTFEAVLAKCAAKEGDR